jgi:hypothetical protein
LLGNVLCRRVVSSLIADGGVGKTAVRIAQSLSLATGRCLTDENVFRRCRVLMVSLEDDKDELRRRVQAAMLHHRVKPEDVKGWLFLAAPGSGGAKLATTGVGGHTVGALEIQVVEAIKRHAIDAVCLDPFVKSHSVEENANNAIDFVAGILARIAIEYDCAVDAPHHVSKGPTDPGNANRGRGASAFKDAARLVYTLTVMTPDEAKLFGVPETERRRLIRMDAGKVNIAPPAASAKWFRLVGVPLGNGTDLYPRGDEVQTVEPWEPPDIWQGMTDDLAIQILTEIDEGLPGEKLYSDHNRAKDERAAWRVVQKHLPDLNDSQCREIIKTWVKKEVLSHETFHDTAERKDKLGLRLQPGKRPGPRAP